MEEKALTEKIANSINSFIHDIFQPNPFDFLYEADIQSAMWSRLRNDIDAKVKWEIEDEEIIQEIGAPSVQTSIVKAQYPNRNLFDIGIIRPNDKRILKGESLEPYWDQKLLVAIELKYLQYRFREEDLWKKFQTDIDKLMLRYGKDFEIGLALLFIQYGEPKERYKNMNLVKVDGISLGGNVGRYLIGKREIFGYVG